MNKLSLVKTVNELRETLGTKDTFRLNTVGGAMKVTVSKDISFFEPVHVEKFNADSTLYYYDVTVADFSKASTYTKLFYAVEIVARMIILDSLNAMPYQDYIDAVVLSYIEEEICISVKSEDLAKDLCKWIPKVAENFAVRELANRYYALRFDNAYKVLSNAKPFIEQLRSYKDLRLNNDFDYITLGVIEMLRSA